MTLYNNVATIYNEHIKTSKVIIMNTEQQEKALRLLDRAIQKSVLTFWQKNSSKRAYVKETFLFDAFLRDEGIACDSAYFDLTSLNLCFDNLRAYENKNGVKFAGSEQELVKTAKTLTNKFLSEQMKK